MSLELLWMCFNGSIALICASPSLPGFWTDCKLPDYEEVVAHPPTPPPPYSESPPDAPQAPAQEDPEPSGRRRHVTGDSGIEVCVCRLDEGEGPEEGDVCQGAAGGCCSHAGKDLAAEPAAAERLV